MTALSKYRIVNVVQRSPEWHKFRQWKIGASMAPIIMNESPWENPLQLYQRIVEGIEVEITPDIQRGISLESEALKYFPGYIPACFQSIERPWQIASLDGWNEKENMIAEIKCPRKFSNPENFGNKYRAQLQHQMCVTETNSCFYAEYVNGELKRIEVMRDEEYIKILIEKEKEFHERLMTFNKPKHLHEQEWSKLI